MYLKSLTLTGFKSFQKKTTVDFCTQVNGVIGPNGSGKSNLLEAIRFAMGEQSGKSFRGNTMKDVIFSGSKTENAVNRAKVELVLDNSDHLLKEFGDQVEVSRTIFRDGTSDYEINQHSVRQKDVQNLFLGAGLGRDTMAFINQGKVQSIIDSDPTARRGVFEEVAGVYKYKLNRREAVVNLESTDAELQRLKDLLFELKSNLKPLELESKRASEYSKLKELYDRLHLFRVVDKIDQLVLNRDSQVKKQTELTNLEDDLKRKIVSSKDQLQSFNEEAEAKQAEQDDLQQKLVQIIKKRDELSSNHQVLITKKEQSQTQIEELKSRISKLKDEEQELNSKQKDIKQDLVALAKELETKVKDHSKLIANSGDSIEELNKNLDKYKEQYFDLLNHKTTLKNELNVLENSQTALKNLITSYQKRIDEKTIVLNELTAKQKKIQADLSSQTKRQDQINSKIKTLTNQKNEILDDRSQLNKEIALINNKKQLLNSQIRDLKEQERSLNGVFEGVKAVLQNSDKLEGIIGTVFQLVTVPEKYQKALSEALGTRFQNIVTVDENAAKKAIAFLKKANKGRATFYPLDRIQEQNLNSNLINKLENVPGFLGVAIDLIGFDPKYLNVISNFFGKLLIAENLDRATNIAHLTQSKYRIVTLDGDLINIGGSMTGGKSVTRNDYFRQTEIEHKEALLSELNESLRIKTDRDQVLKEKIIEFEQLIKNQRNTVKDNVSKNESLQQNFADVNAQINSVNAQIEELKLEIKAQQQTHQSQEKIEDLKNQLKVNASATSELDEKMTLINEKIEKRLRDDNSGLRSELEAKIATLKERNLNYKERQHELKKQLKKNEIEQELSQKQIKSLTDLIKDFEQKVINTAKKLEQSSEQEEQLNQKKIHLIENNKIILSKKLKIDEELLKNQKEVDLKNQQLSDLSVKIARAKVQLDSLLDNLANDYEMSYEAAKNFVETHELTDEDQKSDPQKLQKRLREFGNVNLDAVNEYQKLKERVEFSEKQLNDVEQARSELQESINKLDDQVRQLFKNAFDAVNESFQEIYPEMFNGGTAELKLTEPDDLLKTGVEIVAAPPGKKTRSLSLLSGGEKSLSAITLLFAIIKVSTVPFSILDEVEAALDDANVDRFSQYLERFNGRTQFIVITHRRPTMRAAQRLFGVTMIGTGISKMVSVKLDDDLVKEV